MDSPNLRPSPSAQTPAWRLDRWRFAAAAFLLGVAYTGVALAFGATFRVGERDLTLVAGMVVEVSFAGFGFLLGLAREARQRERAAATAAAGRMDQLARMQARLTQTEKLASLGQLAGAIAHEVRNPLAILRSLVQNLEEDLADAGGTDRSRDTCGQLVEEIDRLAHVTSSLVAFARPPVLERAEVHAADLLERTRLLAEQMLRGRPVHLVLDAPGGPGPVLDVDPDLLCQVLLGLVDNAAKASSEGGRIRLGWRGVDSLGASGAVELFVADEGPGIPDDVSDAVFEPFFTTRSGGAGLGLAVARQIVDAHGGTLAVVDTGGAGAELAVRLMAQSEVRPERGAA